MGRGMGKKFVERVVQTASLRPRLTAERPWDGHTQIDALSMYAVFQEPESQLAASRLLERSVLEG